MITPVRKWTPERNALASNADGFNVGFNPTICM
jgi:hypothetical protein